MNYREYSQGIMSDGATILCDGLPMTVEDILNRLRVLETVREMVYEAPELNYYNDIGDIARELDDAMNEIWAVIERETNMNEHITHFDRMSDFTKPSRQRREVKVKERTPKHKKGTPYKRAKSTSKAF